MSSSFVLAYHGCDAAIAERLLNGDAFAPSANQYDWIGHGIYFWEANPQRGVEYAGELAKRPRARSRIRNPSVVGAVVSLGLCLDLTTSSGIEQVRLAYRALVRIIETSHGAMPKNSDDGLRRSLDCAVINLLHDIRKNEGEQPVDTVKGVFTEGKPIYDGSGFMEKTHTQICVRNPNCIKGVFRVPRAALA